MRRGGHHGGDPDSNRYSAAGITETARRGGGRISTVREQALLQARESSDLHTLIEAAAAGDEAAFAALYARTVGRVHAVCLRLCADTAEAERLTQDTFVLVWRRLGEFRGHSLFTSWLHRIAVNVVLQDRRASGRREDRVQPLPAEVLDRSPARDAGTELHIDLERAIASLPPGARTALVLHDIEGYTHDEIARMTGLAAGTIKAQLHRARRLLQQRLDRP